MHIILHKKSLYLLSIGLFLSTQGYAEKFPKGIYLGGFLGLLSLNGKQSYGQDIIGNPAPTELLTRLTSYRLSYGAFLGYGGLVSGPLYLGAEVYGEFAKPTSTTRVYSPALAQLAGSDGVFGENVQKKPLFGLTTRIGREVESGKSTILPYLKLGAEFSKLGYTAILYTQEQVQSSKSIAGFVVGAGFDYVIQEHLLLRAEWSMAMYSTAKYGNLAFPSGNQRRDIKITPQTQAFRLGVGYTF